MTKSKQPSFDPQANPKLIKELFDYEDGYLRWKPRPTEWFKKEEDSRTWHTKHCGKKAGSQTNSGYRLIGFAINGSRHSYWAHRLVWAWHHGRWPVDQLDHIDHDRSNNRIENLREVSRIENAQNMSIPSGNTSGVVGVYWFKPASLWRAYINTGGKQISLGYFKNQNEAIAARKGAERALGFHPNHGKGRKNANQ